MPRKSTRSSSSSPPASMSTRNPASGLLPMSMKSMTRRASAARAAAETRSYERSGTRPDDADAHRDRHHAGLPHRVYADGAGHVVRLHRVLRPVAGMVAKPGVR